MFSLSVFSNQYTSLFNNPLFETKSKNKSNSFDLNLNTNIIGKIDVQSKQLQLIVFVLEMLIVT